MTAARTVAVVTGSRAEYGLLRPVMRAIRAEPALELRVAVTGTHLVRGTEAEVAADFEIDARVPMQEQGRFGGPADAEALGRGVSGFAAWLAAGPPDVVLVLGDRIEAFAAAAAAAVSGVRVAHVHGGDRATGVHDEALRHAITKLAHVHLPATDDSARRVIGLGEDPGRVHVVGSPAVDDLAAFGAMADEAFETLGRPRIVFLMHPAGQATDQEQAAAELVLASCRRAGRVLVMEPNDDPGREAIVAAIDRAAGDSPRRSHLPRRDFVGLLRRAKLLVGNSSAGLIECAALGVPAVNVGPREAGRLQPPNVIDVPRPAAGDGRAVEQAIASALARGPGPTPHPYGDGRCGQRIAQILAEHALEAMHPLAKRMTY